MWTTKVAALAGVLVSVGLTILAITIGIMVGARFIPTQLWLALVCATVVPAVFAAWVAVPMGQLVYRWLQGKRRERGKETHDTTNV